MVFENAAELIENEEVVLRFAVFSSSGHSVALQTYMGMPGHAVIRRSGGEVFTHLHPVGTISMAAQQIAASERGDAPVTARQPLPATTNSPTTREVTFPYAFPKVGEYRMWVQVRVEGGRIVTGVFDVQVKPERS
jgi:TRAP-type C4-dicarboxylate transport system substrate-binding protein